MLKKVASGKKQGNVNRMKNYMQIVDTILRFKTKPEDIAQEEYQEAVTNYVDAPIDIGKNRRGQFNKKVKLPSSKAESSDGKQK